MIEIGAYEAYTLNKKMARKAIREAGSVDAAWDAHYRGVVSRDRFRLYVWNL